MIAAAILALAPAYALAEYCWMVGCPNAIGYLPVRPAIFGTVMLKQGASATVRNYTYLRQDAIEVAQGPYILGPGTTVKVLELIRMREGGQFAIVRVIADKNDRPQECRSTITCAATFH
jgi:hypothetical protein